MVVGVSPTILGNTQIKTSTVTGKKYFYHFCWDKFWVALRQLFHQICYQDFWMWWWDKWESKLELGNQLTAKSWQCPSQSRWKMKNSWKTDSMHRFFEKNHERSHSMWITPGSWALKRNFSRWFIIKFLKKWLVALLSSWWKGNTGNHLMTFFSSAQITRLLEESHFHSSESTSLCPKRTVEADSPDCIDRVAPQTLWSLCWNSETLRWEKFDVLKRHSMEWHFDRKTSSI